MSQTYILEIPVFRSKVTDKKIKIYDSNKKKIIGYVNRYYANKAQNIFSKTIDITGSVITNVQAEDYHGNKIIDLKYKLQFGFKEEWEVTYFFQDKEYKFKLYNIPKWGFRMHFICEFCDEKFTIIDRTIGIEPKFYDNRDNLLAKCRDKIFRTEVTINIYNDTHINVYFIAAICYLIFLK